jgi:hypothetical protein
VAGDVLVQLCLEGAGLGVEHQLALELGTCGGLLLTSSSVLLKGEGGPVQGESFKLCVKVKSAWIGWSNKRRARSWLHLLLKCCCSECRGLCREAGRCGGKICLTIVLSNGEQILKG